MFLFHDRSTKFVAGTTTLLTQFVAAKNIAFIYKEAIKMTAGPILAQPGRLQA